MVGWFLNVLVNYWVISQTGPKTERLTILRAAIHKTELGDHDFCLSRSHYTHTDPTSRERAATAGIEPGTSSPGVARSTDYILISSLCYHYGISKTYAKMQMIYRCKRENQSYLTKLSD